jgi:hypothetical protein
VFEMTVSGLHFQFADCGREPFWRLRYSGRAAKGMLLPVAAT